MQASVVSILLVTSALSQYSGYARYGTIQKNELDYQQQAFEQWWGDDLELKLDDLPTEGQVPEWRVPYAGHDYPDMGGGTIAALHKYDRAFHRWSMSTDWERMDTRSHRGGGRPETVRGLFGRIRVIRSRTPTWYGHCNGWTAAAIRHAEPQRSVVRNGVVFTPADIKGLLAEIYMYQESEFLGGVDMSINPATLHLTLANWLGRGSHPVGMETAVGEVVINYPIYSYKMNVRQLSSREADVRMTIRYALNTPREYEKGPPNFNRQMYFHYALDLSEDGEIRGGRYFGDSAQIDMLWAPLKPVEGGEEGNKRGNPHVNVKEVLAIWRESVPEDIRKKWLNIDPTEEDRLLPSIEATTSTASAADAVEVPPVPPATGTEGAAGPAAPAGNASTPATAAPSSSTSSASDDDRSRSVEAPPAAPNALPPELP